MAGKNYIEKKLGIQSPGDPKFLDAEACFEGVGKGITFLKIENGLISHGPITRFCAVDNNENKVIQIKDISSFDSLLNKYNLVNLPSIDKAFLYLLISENFAGGQCYFLKSDTLSISRHPILKEGIQYVKFINKNKKQRKISSRNSPCFIHFTSYAFKYNIQKIIFTYTREGFIKKVKIK
jgi:hypothetical protein